MDGWVERRSMDGWIDVLMDEGMDEWIEGRKFISVPNVIFISLKVSLPTFANLQYTP